MVKKELRTQRIQVTQLLKRHKRQLWKPHDLHNHRGRLVEHLEVLLW